MPLERRPSLFNTPRYVAEDEHQIQKSIQALRLKTQESLAESRDEIARLEEENEIKQMRIEEIDAEIEELEAEGQFGRMASLKHIETTRGRARRRWSLAGFGIGPKGDDEEEDRRGRRSKSVEDDDLSLVDDSEDATPSTPSRRKFTLAGMKQPSFRKPKSPVPEPEGMNNFDKTMKKEALLMQRLHIIQEENKKVIEHHETNLHFKEEQVTAMQLAYDEQCNIIESLEEEIEQLRTEIPEGQATLPEEDMTRLNEQLLSLSEKENEISSQMRVVRKIQKMDEDERKAAVSVLKREILESSIQLNAVKRMFEANKEMLQGDLSKSEEEWALLSVKISLMERLSQKQIRRLQKKASKSESSDELTELLDRATRALEEELMMRDGSSEPSVDVLLLETGFIVELVTDMLDCISAFAEGLVMLRSKDITLHIGDTIMTTLRQMEKTTEVTESTVSSALFVLEEATETYDQDGSLLPDDVQKAYHQEVAEDDESTASEEATDQALHINVSSNEDRELEDIQDQNDDLERRVVEAKQKLETAQEQAGDELHVYTSRIGDLKLMYEQGGIDWDKKDEEIEKVFKEVEEAKVDEDKLRDFLKRVARSKVEDEQ